MSRSKHGFPFGQRSGVFVEGLQEKNHELLRTFEHWDENQGLCWKF